jgi:hypothetical protein
LVYNGFIIQGGIYMGWESDKDNDVIENRSVEDDNTGSKD